MNLYYHIISSPVALQIYQLVDLTYLHIYYLIKTAARKNNQEILFWSEFVTNSENIISNICIWAQLA